jgi:hypothetical protein
MQRPLETQAPASPPWLGRHTGSYTTAETSQAANSTQTSVAYTLGAVRPAQTKLRGSSRASGSGSRVKKNGGARKDRGPLRIAVSSSVNFALKRMGAWRRSIEQQGLTVEVNMVGGVRCVVTQTGTVNPTTPTNRHPAHPCRPPTHPHSRAVCAAAAGAGRPRPDVRVIGDDAFAKRAWAAAGAAAGSSAASGGDGVVLPAEWLQAALSGGDPHRLQRRALAAAAEEAAVRARRKAETEDVGAGELHAKLQDVEEGVLPWDFPQRQGAKPKFQDNTRWQRRRRC